MSYDAIRKAYKNEIENKFSFLPGSEELPERMGILNHLHPESVVLEIGGGDGGVSILIAHVLTNSKHFLTIEANPFKAKKLLQLGHIFSKPFYVFNGVLTDGSYKLDCISKDIKSYSICNNVVVNEHTENLTFFDMQEKYNLKFDTLIIDCEGCYKYFLLDILKLPQIKQVQIEWDGEFLEDKILKEGFRLVCTYKHICLPNGVRIYER